MITSPATANAIVDKFLTFINQSPTPFHAVSNAINRLESAGFKRLKERDQWTGNIQKGGKYYVTRLIYKTPHSSACSDIDILIYRVN
jgi:aspartyl aminopeptidase